MSTCTACGNTGWVVVPHPLHVHDGLWKPHHRNEAGRPVYATAAVTCSCSKGRKVVEAMERQEVPVYKMPLSIEKYREKVYHDPQEIYDEVFPPAKSAWPTGTSPRAAVKEIVTNYGQVPY